MELPDISEYVPHRSVRDAAFEGTPVPGLRAEFFRREERGRVASVGRYALGGRELLMAWGWVDEEHCRFSAVRDPGGSWHPATAGCPVVRLLRAGPGKPVTGLAVRAPSGEWITA